MRVDPNDPLALPDSVRNQLKGNGRRRRQALSRLAQATASSLPARNDILPLLELVVVSLSDLRVSSRAVRKLDPAHVREVADNIGNFGFLAPLLIGKGNAVIDGVVRLEAAKLRGLDRLYCIRIDHLSETDQRLARLALNRLAEKGQWDLEVMKVELKELILLGAPIEISGFSGPEIEHILLNDAPEAIEEGALAPNDDAVAIARSGDCFRLGLHLIICGDARDATLLARLMGGVALARIVLTDQPFNVRIAGHVTGGAHREFVMASGEMTRDEFLAFNLAWIRSVLLHLCDGGILGSFIDWRGYATLVSAAEQLGLSPLNLIVWAKANAGMGSLYRSQHELLPLFKNGEAAHLNNIELGKKGRWRSNVWQYPGASSLGSDARHGLKDHPTVKPTAMLEDALLDLTNRGDIVIDPFLGSGSTLIAAEKTGRICRGVELDPRYVDVAVRRYEKVTGNSAILAETGETFSALAARRAAEAAAEMPSAGVG